MSRAFRLGAFIVATLLIFAGGVFWIGTKQFLFRSTYRLNAEFQNVAGLHPGAEVRVGGIHKGTVKEIVLPQRSDQKVRVVMQVATATRDVIKKDSVAAIRSEGLVGDRFVEISFGSSQSPNVVNNDTIQSEPAFQLAELIKKTNLLLDSAQEAAENLGAISAKINQGSGTLGALVNDKTFYQNVTAGTVAFQENMEALKHNFFLRGFFKKRGYKDSTDLKKHEIAQLPAGPPTKKFSYDGGKIFDKPDTAKLKEPKILNEAAAYLEGNPFGLAVVTAYTDMRGDSEKERVLTEARAMVIRDYLAEHFKLNDTRIKTKGLGKSEQSGEAGKVEILIYPAAPQVAQTGRPPRR